MAKTVEVKPINKQTAMIPIEGISPYLQHRWDEKTLRELEEKRLGETGQEKDRSPRNPEREYRQAMYLLGSEDSGEYGIPVTQIIGAMISAAHNDRGIPKSLVRQAVFIIADGYDRGIGAPLVRMKTAGPKQRTDLVRVGRGAPDIRYRPIFMDWSADVRVEYDADLLKLDSIVNLVERGGYGIGIGEWRPQSQKGGEMGRFRVRRGTPA